MISTSQDYVDEINVQEKCFHNQYEAENALQEFIES